MISLLVSDLRLRTAIASRLNEAGVNLRLLAVVAGQNFEEFYRPDVRAIVADAIHPLVHEGAWLDLLNSLGRRIPVIVLAGEDRMHSNQSSGKVDNVTWLINPNVDDILHVLDACGVAGRDVQVARKESVPVYNIQIPINTLRSLGSLSILTIDASQFRNVAIEYGSDVYYRLQECFQENLHALWGTPGNFRTRDILCRRAPDSNTYYIFLEPARAASQLPPPGALEKLADRLVTRIQNRLWDELLAPTGVRRLPACLKTIPDFSVGYATALFNPCVDVAEAVDSLFESSREMARVQMIRVRNRQRELLHTLIKTEGLLLPNYQAVFTVDGISKEEIAKTNGGRNIKPIQDKVFAFESLIRVQAAAVDKVVANDGPLHLEARFLRPDILFALAGNAKLSLELDQACLRRATEGFKDFPYHLMVNILPRNIYYISQLRDIFPMGIKVTFELSEAEDINNFELLLQVRKHLGNLNFGIAADDFGKGFASLDRVLKIEPDIIKLDRSLVQDIDKDPPKFAFVRGLIDATKVSQSMILAEGVETWEEFEVLASLGVNLVQGFLFHRPQSLDEIKRCMGEPADLAASSAA